MAAVNEVAPPSETGILNTLSRLTAMREMPKLDPHERTGVTDWLTVFDSILGSKYESLLKLRATVRLRAGTFKEYMARIYNSAASLF